MSLFEQIEHHKIISGLCSVGLFLTGKWVGMANIPPIPPEMLQWTQEIAYITSILVGAITIIAWLSKKIIKLIAWLKKK